MGSGLRTMVVGSWWPQAEYEAGLQRVHRGKVSDDERQAVLSGSAQKAIRQQMALGLTEWTGGEYFTDEFLNHMQKVLTGIEIEVPSKPILFDYDDFAHAKITGQINAPNGMGYLSGFLREKALFGGVRKATVVGPLEMAFNAMDQFPQLMAQLPNLIEVVNVEIRGLAAAGCPNIQLDVPTFATLMTMDALTAEEAARIITRCFDGVTGVRRGIHICSGNMRGRPLAGNLTCAHWAGILERLDGVIDYAHIAVQYFCRYLERDAFASVPRSIDIAAGIIDEGCYGVEPVEKIRDRPTAWAKVVGEERLWLAPSCGFGRHPAQDAPLLEAKIKNMVEAAATF
jgi:5-methyltetrahydropteroyltriglutamate--homocysteine methyltransferase